MSISYVDMAIPLPRQCWILAAVAWNLKDF